MTARFHILLPLALLAVALASAAVMSCAPRTVWAQTQLTLAHLTPTTTSSSISPRWSCPAAAPGPEPPTCTPRAAGAVPAASRQGISTRERQRVVRAPPHHQRQHPAPVERPPERGDRGSAHRLQRHGSGALVVLRDDLRRRRPGRAGQLLGRFGQRHGRRLGLGDDFQPAHRLEGDKERPPLHSRLGRANTNPPTIGSVITSGDSGESVTLNTTINNASSALVTLHYRYRASGAPQWTSAGTSTTQGTTATKALAALSPEEPTRRRCRSRRPSCRPAPRGPASALRSRQPKLQCPSSARTATPGTSTKTQRQVRRWGIP